MGLFLGASVPTHIPGNSLELVFCTGQDSDDLRAEKTSVVALTWTLEPQSHRIMELEGLYKAIEPKPLLNAGIQIKEI